LSVIICGCNIDINKGRNIFQVKYRYNC